MRCAHYLEFQGPEGEGAADGPVRLVDVDGDVSQALQRRHPVQRTANLKRSMTGNGTVVCSSRLKVEGEEEEEEEEWEGSFL